MTEKLLRDPGYRPLLADFSHSAVGQVQEVGSLDLLLIDVIMP